MEAPSGMKTIKDLEQTIKSYLTQNGVYICKKCNSEIKFATCFVSIHLKEFGGACAGTGEVRSVPLPYCAKCEGEPICTFTCVHV